MTSIRKITRFLIAGALVAVGFVGTSEASTITIMPGSQTIGPGGTATVDIVLSGLTPNEIVGGFSAVLSYNPGILQGSAFDVDPGHIMANDPSLNNFSGGFNNALGTLDLFYGASLTDYPDDPPGDPAGAGRANLKTSEGTGFVLATVSFTGLAQGTSPLILGVVAPGGTFLTDFDGNDIAPRTIEVVNGSVCVSDPLAPAANCAAVEPVPEPATLTLLGGGLVALVARRRRKAVAQA